MKKLTKFNMERKPLIGFETLDSRKYTGSCIYVIRNTSNDKIYIGKTINYHDRYHHYKQYLQSPTTTDKRVNRYLLRAFAKYRSFQIFILENCSIELLNEREIFWIGFFKSNCRNKGYNLTSGGDGIDGSYFYKPILVYCADTGNFISEYVSLQATEKATGVKYTKVSQVARGKRFCSGNLIFRYKTSDIFPQILSVEGYRRCKRKMHIPSDYQHDAQSPTR